MHILVRIDPKRCMANRQCSALAPGLFEPGDDGVTRITRRDPTDFSGSELPMLLRARDGCPTGAILVETLEDDEAPARENVGVPIDPTVRAYLDEPRYAVLATLNADGSAHLTEMWYELRGDEIIFNTTEERHKKQNLERDARVSVLVGGRKGEPVWKTITYVRVDGRARRVADGARAFEDIVRLAVRYDGPSAEAGARANYANAHRVTYAVRVRRVYRKGL